MPSIGLSMVFLIASSMTRAEDAVYIDQGRYYTADQFVIKFCLNSRETCVIDMTSSKSKCSFASDAVTLEKGGFASGKSWLEKHCPGMRWRKVHAIQLFEPINRSESALEVHVEALSSTIKVGPQGYLAYLASKAEIRSHPEYRGGDIKPAPRRPLVYRTPAGTLKNALLSAARQNPGSIWVVARFKKGFRLEAMD